MKPHTRIVIVFLLFAACLSPILPASPLTISQAAQSTCNIANVVKTVGEYSNKASETSDPNVILIQEIHSLRAGQLESAVMIHRLLRDCGYRFLGLEGAFPDTSFDTKWFDTAFPLNVSAGTAVNMLGEGEINQVEFGALVYPPIYHDLNFAGIDDKALYSVKTPVLSGDIQTLLFYEAFANLSDSDVSTASSMLKNKPDSKSDPDGYDKWREDLMKFVFTNARPSEFGDWYKLANPKLDRCTTLSAESDIELVDKGLAISQQYRKDAEKALGMSLASDVKAIEAVRTFYQNAHDRSVTMVKNIEQSLKESPTSKIVAIIGAAHTEYMQKQLDDDGNKVLVLSTKSYCDNDMSTEMSDSSYDLKAGGKSIDAKGKLGSLLAGKGIKPPFILNQPIIQVKSTLYGIAALANEALATDPNATLSTIFQNVNLLPGVTVDPKSLKPVKTKSGSPGYTFHVKINVKGVAAKQIVIGINPGLNKQLPNDDSLDIEAMLLGKLDQVKNDAKNPNPKPSPYTEVAPDVKAIFGTSDGNVNSILKDS